MSRFGELINILSSEQHQGRSRFTQFKPLGSGSQGDVIRAYDQSLGRNVAVKVTKDDNPRVHSLYQKEARIMGKSTPHVVDVLDYLSLSPQGSNREYPALLMELANAGLDEVVGSDHYTDSEGVTHGPITDEEKIKLYEDFVKGLSNFHQLEISGGEGEIHTNYHRDVKPSNVLIFDGEERVAKLGDFGLATYIKKSTSAKGTLSYRAPEEAKGKADQRADIYAAGLLLYELLTARNPFNLTEENLPGENVNPTEYKMRNIQDRKQELNPESLDYEGIEDFSPIVIRAMRRDPNRRFQTAEELLNHFQYARDNNFQISVLTDVKTLTSKDKLKSEERSELEKKVSELKNFGVLDPKLMSEVEDSIRIDLDPLMKKYRERLEEEIPNSGFTSPEAIEQLSGIREDYRSELLEEIREEEIPKVHDDYGNPFQQVLQDRVESEIEKLLNLVDEANEMDIDEEELLDIERVKEMNENIEDLLSRLEKGHRTYQTWKSEFPSLAEEAL